MIQEEQYKGTWTILGTDINYDGSLKFDPINGPRLELHGSFGLTSMDRPIQIILGATTNGWVTLYDTHHQSGHGSNVTKTHITVYKPTFIFEGHQFQSPDDLCFDSVSFSIFNLLEWFDNCGLFQDGNFSLENISYKKPAKISFQCYDGCEANVEFGLTGRFLNQFYKINLDQTCEVTLQYDKNKHFREILSDVFKFVSFTAFCTYEQSYPIHIFFFREDLIDDFVQRKLHVANRKSIKLIYQNTFYNPRYKIRYPGQHLLRYNDIHDSLGSIVQGWFSKSVELEPVMKLLLISFINQYEFSTEKFMDTIRALETFHRFNHNKPLFTSDELASMMKKVSELELPKDQLDAIKSKIEHADEPYLAKRLAELIELYSFDYFNERVPDTKKFIIKAATSRNSYTHPDPAKPKSALKGAKLFDLTENLKLLLFSAILTSIGVKKEFYDQTTRSLIY